LQLHHAIALEVSEEDAKESLCFFLSVQDKLIRRHVILKEFQGILH